MNKLIRILEIPIYLLVIGLFCLEQNFIFGSLIELDLHLMSLLYERSNL